MTEDQIQQDILDKNLKRGKYSIENLEKDFSDEEKAVSKQKRDEIKEIDGELHKYNSVIGFLAGFRSPILYLRRDGKISEMDGLSDYLERVGINEKSGNKISTLEDKIKKWTKELNDRKSNLSNPNSPPNKALQSQSQSQKQISTGAGVDQSNYSAKSRTSSAGGGGGVLSTIGKGSNIPGFKPSNKTSRY